MQGLTSNDFSLLSAIAGLKESQQPAEMEKYGINQRLTEFGREVARSLTGGKSNDEAEKMATLIMNLNSKRSARAS